MIKKWEIPSFWKALLLAFMNFMITNIERFAGINFAVVVIFTSSFILQIMNILALIFWNLWVLEKLRHCFFNLKGNFKLIKNYIHYSCWYQCYYKWHLYHYFHIVHYPWINWITWTYTHCIFPYLCDCRSSYRKTKIIPVNLSPPGTQTTTTSSKKYFLKWWFLNIHRFRL